MNHEQLLASYPDDLAKHAATSGWNAANTVMLNAILDQITVATEAGNYSTASTLFKLLDDLKATLAIKRV
jgi:hypothetical protein